MRNLKDKTIRLLQGGLWMLLAFMGSVALLFMINRLPSVIHSDYAAKFESIDAAKRFSGMETIAVPAYFPEGLSWPPSMIVAEKRPFKTLAMEFRDRAGKDSLIVIQSSQHDNIVSFQRIRMSEINQESEYLLKGRKALLRAGLCDNGKRCSSMSWQDADSSTLILFLAGPIELIKIAESTVR